MSIIKKVHEIYHSKTRKQTKIINDSNFTYRLLLSSINKYIKSRKKILDIGCGAGTISLYLASKGHDVLGVDISSKAIRECLKSKRAIGLTNVDFRELNFPKRTINSKFDVVIFTEVIEHLEDDKRAVENIYKLLNTNGILILSTPSNKAPLHRLGLTKKFDKEVGHLRRYSLEGLTSILNKNNFQIIEIRQTEGILRNFLFINPIAGKFVRFIKFFISDWVTYLDNLTIPLFGNSNFIIIARKSTSR